MPNGLGARPSSSQRLDGQDGRLADVVRIAAEIEPVLVRGRVIWSRYRWIYLFPLIAAHLGHTDAGTHVDALAAMQPRHQFADLLETVGGRADDAVDRGRAFAG